MGQTNLIVAALIFAFFVFITVRGHLPQYLGLLLPSNAPSAPPVESVSEYKKAQKLIQDAVKSAGD